MRTQTQTDNTITFFSKQLIDFIRVRFVSDYALNGFKALCQHKLLQAMQKSKLVPDASRTYPPSLLEWTVNRKKACVVLQVYCFDGKTKSNECDILVNIN